MQQRRPWKRERPTDQKRNGDKWQQKRGLAAASRAQAGADREGANRDEYKRKRHPNQERVEVQIGLLLFRGRRLVALDDFGDAIVGGGQAVSISLLAKGGKKLLVENAAGERIRQNWLQAVADFNAGFAILNGDKQQNAVLLILLADAPAGKELDGEVVDLAAFKRFEPDDGELSAGLFAHLLAALFQRVALGRGETAGEVVDVSCWLK